MTPLRHCPGCQSWFVPAHKAQWLCEKCANDSMGRTVVWWFAAMAGTVIAILAWLLIFKQ